MKTKTIDRDKLAAASAEGTGRAALLSINLDDPHKGGAMWELFEETTTTPNPIAAAHALIRGIREDWPGHTFTVVGNERAKFLEWRRRLASLGFSPEESTPEQYAEV